MADYGIAALGEKDPERQWIIKKYIGEQWTLEYWGIVMPSMQRSSTFFVVVYITFSSYARFGTDNIHPTGCLHVSLLHSVGKKRECMHTF